MIGSGVAGRRVPGLRRPGGRRGSIREVRLVGLSAASEGPGPGDSVGWWGRSYEVEAAESAREGARVGYLHLKPADRRPDGA
jgi:hypothetical protein